MLNCEGMVRRCLIAMGLPAGFSALAGSGGRGIGE
jgi:hypothetical protein